MNKLTGLKIKLDRPIDRERPCCLNICTIGAARGPHTGELRCADCGQHRGWLSNSTAQWIEHVASRFGAPATPIVVRALEQDRTAVHPPERPNTPPAPVPETER